jgi:hypothetical protein
VDVLGGLIAAAFGLLLSVVLTMGVGWLLGMALDQWANK